MGTTDTHPETPELTGGMRLPFDDAASVGSPAGVYRKDPPRPGY
jgi:hypothetical protein